MRSPRQVQFTGEKDGIGGTMGEGEEMVRGLQGAQEGVDEKLQRSQIQFFQVRAPLGLPMRHRGVAQRRVSSPPNGA